MNSHSKHPEESFTTAPIMRPHSIGRWRRDRKSTRLNSSHLVISYAVFCLKKKKKQKVISNTTKQHNGLVERPVNVLHVYVETYNVKVLQLAAEYESCL